MTLKSLFNCSYLGLKMAFAPGKGKKQQDIL